MCCWNGTMPLGNDTFIAAVLKMWATKLLGILETLSGSPQGQIIFIIILIIFAFFCFIGISTDSAKTMVYQVAGALAKIKAVALKCTNNLHCQFLRSVFLEMLLMKQSKSVLI